MRFTEIISEDANPKRQAAIAIAMKKAGKKPKDVTEAGITGSSRSAEAIAKQKEWNSSSASDSKQDTKTFSYQGYTINFTPDKLNIYLGGDLVFSRKGNFADPTKKQLVAARLSIGKIIDDKRREALIHSVIQKNKGMQGVAEGPSEVMGLASFALGGGIPGGESPSDIVEFAPYDHNDSDDDFDDEGDDELRSLYDTKFELEAELDYADEEDREHLESELEDVHARILELNPDATLEEGENWSKYNHKRVGGMSKKSVNSYRRSHPGSKIQTAVTTKPSKLKKGSKAAKRRASFCARMRGMKKHRTGAKTAHDPNSNINKSLRRWHCESIEELHELVMLAEQFIRNNKK